jgi:hypothetical protein
MKASGALAGPLSGESSELPRCVSCSKKIIEFQGQALEVVGCKEGPRHSTCTYQEDGGKQPLVQTFFGKGPDSPRENEDTVATAADDS